MGRDGLDGFLVAERSGGGGRHAHASGGRLRGAGGRWGGRAGGRWCACTSWATGRATTRPSPWRRAASPPSAPGLSDPWAPRPSPWRRWLGPRSQAVEGGGLAATEGRGSGAAWAARREEVLPAARSAPAFLAALAAFRQCGDTAGGAAAASREGARRGRPRPFASPHEAAAVGAPAAGSTTTATFSPSGGSDGRAEREVGVAEPVELRLLLLLRLLTG